MFITIEGIDGAGKTLQVKQTCEWLQERYPHTPVISCRDPGGTELGERIRPILLEEKGTPICLRSEALLYMASRAQLVDEIIAPALKARKIVVSDRYLLSNVMYQGYASDLPTNDLWMVGKYAVGGLHPDLTILLDLSVEEAMKRWTKPDRLESRGVEFQQKLRKGFLENAREFCSLTKEVNADQPVEDVQHDIQEVIKTRIEQLLASNKFLRDREHGR